MGFGNKKQTLLRNRQFLIGLYWIIIFIPNNPSWEFSCCALSDSCWVARIMVLCFVAAILRWLRCPVLRRKWSCFDHQPRRSCFLGCQRKVRNITLKHRGNFTLGLKRMLWKGRYFFSILWLITGEIIG